MEARSVEDGGEGLKFSVFCYNVQPGIAIDYKTGASRLKNGEANEADEKEELVLNTKSKKYHLPSCSAVFKMKEKNKIKGAYSRAALEAKGYTPCAICAA